jgi:hypothetical protein
MRTAAKIICFVLAAAGFSGRANADLSQMPSLNDLVTPSLQREAIRMVGVLAAHRPYQPATPLGMTLGLEATIETSLVQVPQSFFDELAASGVAGSFDLRTLPVAKLHLHKGILSNLDLGASYFGFQDVRLYGADLKWTLIQPEEGPTWALRLCYSQSSIRYFSTKSWSPQLLVSRRLHFADAYLGAEYTAITGRIRGTETADTIGGPVTTSLDLSGIRARSGSAFLGLGLRLPALGIKASIEGAYSFVKAHSLGASLGISW